MNPWQWLRYVFSDFMPAWLWCTFALIIGLLIVVYSLRHS